MKDKPVQRQKLYNAAYEEYVPGRQLTAKECAAELYKKGIVPYPERFTIAPRLTEMCDLGMLERVGRKWDNATQKMVTVYQRKEA